VANADLITAAFPAWPPRFPRAATGAPTPG
jgi:hypothetical protein